VAGDLRSRRAFRFVDLVLDRADMKLEPRHKNIFVTACAGCGKPLPKPAVKAPGRPRLYPYCDAPACRRAAAAARQRACRARDRTVFTVFPNNSDLIKAMARLHLKRGMVVADVTYGNGTFWKKVDTSRYDFRASDIALGEAHVAANFRALPYADDSTDVVVFDPPYTHQNASASHIYADRYGARFTRGFSHQDIVDLYAAGMTEAVRVLKRGGQLWTKCQDEVESGQQRLTHIEIHRIAKKLGLRVLDFAVVAPPPPRRKRWKRQLHARKAHSYLWLFRVNGVRRNMGQSSPLARRTSLARAVVNQTILATVRRISKGGNQK
jgi:hypothetical protein